MKKKLTAAFLLLLALCLCFLKPAAQESQPSSVSEKNQTESKSPSDSSKDDKIQEIIDGGNRTESHAED